MFGSGGQTYLPFAQHSSGFMGQKWRIYDISDSNGLTDLGIDI